MDKKIIIEELKNTGLVLAPPADENYRSPLFGALGIATTGTASPLTPAPILFPDGVGWKRVVEMYGEPELQFNRKVDSFSCVLFGIAKQICYYILKAYGIKYTVEEMFNAFYAGVVPNQGTTVERGFESYRKRGWIADGQFAEYTFDENTTQADFFRRPPEYVVIEAAKKLDVWKLNWEVIPNSLPAIFEAYKRYVVGLTGFAWASLFGEGVYYDYNNPANHYFVGLEALPNGNNLIGDTYPKDFQYVENSQIRAGDLFKELDKSFKYGSAHVCWVTPASNTLINKIMDFWRRLSNGAIYWGKGGTNKIQKVTPENAGLVAITHIMRKAGEDSMNISDEELKNYEITEEFFGSSPSLGVANDLIK